ncbi:hypothetical protein JCM30237_08970 [Halolamina litorea]|uniref:hypothetical protein n=1 Tax=Halolamina litorea TaxID=1515593 RepID=UPI00226F3745|nr:hypothetical protein [Halolamina litorea]
MPDTTEGGSIRAVVGGVHGSDADALLGRASRAPQPTELVVTPERLHRRNLKRRLAEHATPRSSLRLTDATTIADDLLDGVGEPVDTIDRIDRLNHFETLLQRKTESNRRLRAAFGGDLPARVETIAAAHSRVGELTGWADDRLDDLSTVADGLPGVDARDTADVVAGVRALEDRLVERVAPIHSRETLLPAAADALREDPGRWRETFPAAERLSVAGVSAVDAPLLGLLDAAAAAGVTVTVSLRPGTGPDIAERLSDRLDVEPGRGVGTPGARNDTETAVAPGLDAAEFVADTPEGEARVAAAVVAGHLRNGVSPSDVLIVARDAGEYERSLRRALGRHGATLAVWAQLPAERTVPYRQFAAVCELLGNDGVDVEGLLEPLSFEWVPPQGDAEEGSTAWPLSAARVGALRAGLADESPDPTERSVDGWADRLDDAVDSGQVPGADAAALRTFLDWVREQPTAPEPPDIHRTFEPLVESGRETALPAVFAADSDDLSRTSRYARALSRVEELLTDTRAKYDEWLAAGDVPRSWLAVADLAERVVTTRPGRREHANAAAVDAIDATDAWLREVPHVVAVGLVDGVWPRRVESVFPEAFRSAVVKGDSAAARRLAVPGRWTAAREVDHLASGLGAATESLAVTRYRRDREGTAMERSPLLSRVSADSVDESATQSLLTRGTLPDALAAGGGGSR